MGVNLGGEQEVMINVSLPDETRADSADGFDLDSLKTDANYQLRYILEIYRDGAEDGKKYRDVKYSDDTSVSFPVRLAPGRAYSIAVWADVVEQVENAPGLYYNAESLKNISINESYWTAMDEKRDAFYGNASLGTNDHVADMSTITLKRPFAKVRVISTDIAVVRNLGLAPTDVSVEYSSKLYTSFDAVNGAAVGAATSGKVVTANYANAKYDDFDALNTTEATLFADYIFVPADGTIQFAMTVNADAGEINTASFTTPIPVEVNKVTTIKGDVLTEGGNVSVKIENELGEKETINMVNTAESLQEIINNTQVGESANIALGGDIDLDDFLGAGILSTRAAEPTYGLLIPAGKSVVLDLNGFTISQSKTQTTAYSMIENRGTLTIKDSSANKTGKLSYADNGQGGNYVSNTIQNSGVLTIEGGIVENNSSATVASNGYPHPIDNSGTLVINGGTFTNNANYSSMRIWCTTDDNTIVTINGGTFNGSIDFQTVNAAANKGTLTITGGTFNADTYTKCAVRLLGFGTDVDEMNGYIRGGQFNGAIALRKFVSGDFNSKVFDITGGTFTVDPSEFVNDDYTVKAENGLWKVVRKSDVAKIGDVGYTSLAKAVAAVKDGETITLVANEVFTENNYYDNGGWKDGLGYAGDKSFTIDLGGYTISQNGALNDYLLWFKNVGSKANTITIKNGTLDAGTTAYCALCTASSHENELTINLENITLTNKISNGSTIKVRAGSTLNVNAGTKIIGQDSYLGIENWNATVNVYEGAEIYMNGTSSYNGCLIGVGGNGVANVYGGYGKGVSGGLIAMTSGGTINVSGGEWIANTDGTYANSNKSVLVAQSDKQYNAGAGNAVVNVTGGTFKGGYNCYGNAVGDAQINIKGGNFNANPTSYVVAGYEVKEENGVYTVGKPKALADFEAAIAQGGEITLTKDITLLEPVVIEDGIEVVLNLNGKTITGSHSKSVGAIIKNEGTLTINGGTVSSTGANGGSAIQNNGQLIIDGTKIIGSSIRENNGWPSYPINNYGSSILIKNATITGYQGAIACNTAGTVTLENCTIRKEYLDTSSHVFYINHDDAKVIVNSGTYTHYGMDGSLAYVIKGIITINGGTFEASNGGYGIAALTNGTVVINGGTFNNALLDWGGSISIKGGTYKHDPKNFVAEGYQAVKENGVWTVSKQ